MTRWSGVVMGIEDIPRRPPLHAERETLGPPPASSVFPGVAPTSSLRARGRS
ncbi:MAG: hypothetical protein R3B96_09080 [Pirellulaceae bacterium]